MKSKGLWRWCVIICKTGFLDIVHLFFLNKITTFRKLDLLPPGLRLAQPGGPTSRVSALPFLPEDGRRSSFRNVVILLKYRRLTKSKNRFYRLRCYFLIHVSGGRKIVALKWLNLWRLWIRNSEDKLLVSYKSGGISGSHGDGPSSSTNTVFKILIIICLFCLCTYRYHHKEI
jgi:hypothetical protein